MIRDYVGMARPDHWFKNVFVIPGVLLGWIAAPHANVTQALGWLGVGVLATCLACSSNYTINEWLDAPEDRKHPEKHRRPAAAGRVKAPIVYAQWIGLGLISMALGWFVGWQFLLSLAALLVMGMLYNIRPIRLKDWPYLDVLSESVNNPLRLLLGWYAVQCPLVPPASLLLSYWMIGAFLMAIKRLAEMRHIGDQGVAQAYRKSFKHYTPERVLISMLFYATAFGFFGGIFLIRYRIELILGVPFLAGFIAMYTRLGFLPNSPTQRPEELYRNKPFVAYTCLTAVILLACLVIRLPWLDGLFNPTIPAGR